MRKARRKICFDRQEYVPFKLKDQPKAQAESPSPLAECSLNKEDISFVCTRMV